jgi:enoyl-CoA hydratase/carnithine racemase
MTARHLLVESEGDIVTITLDRPEKRNALALDVMLELTETFEHVGESDALGVVLAANGPVFSAGHNFGDMAGASIDDARHLFAVCTALMDTVQSIPQPVVARVHALATAAGCQLVATCDLAIASTAATFATPGVNIGAFCSTPGVALGRAVGRKHAMEMLLTGAAISAARAHEIGLVNRVVPADALDAEASGLAALIASRSSNAISSGKTAFYRQLELPVDEAYAVAGHAIAGDFFTEDGREGVDAFLGKRAPRWPDRR